MLPFTLALLAPERIPWQAPRMGVASLKIVLRRRHILTGGVPDPGLILAVLGNSQCFPTGLAWTIDGSDAIR